MYSSTHSLTSALDGGEWSASRPCRFIPKERADKLTSKKFNPTGSDVSYKIICQILLSHAWDRLL
jgi:hypothetical protein